MDLWEFRSSCLAGLVTIGSDGNQITSLIAQLLKISSITQNQWDTNLICTTKQHDVTVHSGKNSGWHALRRSLGTFCSHFWVCVDCEEWPSHLFEVWSSSLLPFSQTTPRTQSLICVCIRNVSTAQFIPTHLNHIFLCFEVVFVLHKSALVTNKQRSIPALG